MPRKYNTDEERRSARLRTKRKYYQRLCLSPTVLTRLLISSNSNRAKEQATARDRVRTSRNPEMTEVCDRLLPIVLLIDRLALQDTHRLYAEYWRLSWRLSLRSKPAEFKEQFLR